MCAPSSYGHSTILPVVVSAWFYAVVFWGSSINKRALNKINKLIRKTGSVVGVKLDYLEIAAEQRTLNKLLVTLGTSHPTLDKKRSTFGGRLLQLLCVKELCVRSFLPTAIRLYESPYCRDGTDLLLSELC